MTEGLQEALVAVLVWATTGIGRALFPDYWERLSGEKVRLVVVGLVAAGFAVATGISQGLGAWAIVQLGLTALAGSVLLRRVTKGGKDTLEFEHAKRKLRQDRGVRTGRATPSAGTTL